ncbi:two-component regulator propeller domain-containing protein [Pontibacter sp. Tf4]|uniref:two-component regulator propeller domain-containing protein n=1 Tax=Pontibacter sp. Tf4 TaxID=2761620 RepID=UPI00162A374F
MHTVWAQQYNFRNWTIADGLPQSDITDLLQDNRMRIWVATRGGISLFDGSSFRTYNRQQGLASNNVSTLFQDSRNQLWIGSADNGLTKYDGQNFSTFGSSQGLPATAIHSITENNLGQLLVATDSGVYRLQQNRFIKHDKLPPQPYLALHTDALGTVWAGSKENGLYKISGSEVQHYKSLQYKLPSNTITAIYSERTDGKLWIGTSGGPAYLEDKTIAQLPLPPSVTHPLVSDFTQDAYGKILVALQQDGLLSVDQEQVQHLTRANGLSSNHISALLLDSEKNTWIGTSGYGLQQRRAQWFMHYFTIGDIQEPHITALAQDTKGTVWFGTANGEAAYMQNGRQTTLDANVWPPGTILYSMWVISPENVWVSTSRGVWNLRPRQAKHYTTANGLPADEVYFVAADARNNVWFATAGGVASLQNGEIKRTIVSDDPETGKAYHIYRDKQNRLWFGTEKGVYLLTQNKLHKVPALQKHAFTEVRAITEDGNGWLYFGGYNYGLLGYHQPTGETKLFNADSGLPGEGIKSLYADRDNNLWIATNRNVLKADLAYFHDTRKLKYREYNGQNGFSGLEVSYNGITQTPDGRVWFGTIKGLTQYIPELDRINKAAPQLRLTDIRLFMRPTDWQQLGYRIDQASGLPVNLRLPHSKDHITFYYHGICLSDPARVRYRYMLEGHDQQWSETSEQPYATYANLGPGTYTFKLKARNNDGYWTQQPLTYTFSVVPPVWRREWFIALLLLLVTGSLISVVRLRERSLVKMNTLLDMRVKHRTRMLERKHREKELLLQEVHHRVKNNLQIVISLLNLQARHVQDPIALEAMQALRSRVRSMALLHERLYRHNNLEHINLENYFREICESLYASYGITEEKVNLHISVPPINVDIDTAITLGLVVNELISNTLKYAFPDGRDGRLGIDLEHLRGDTYQLIVWDNGVGTPEVRDQQQSFGLKLVSSLIKKLDGEINFENINGTKTILHFVLPS